jgi:hypothetical protein
MNKPKPITEERFFSKVDKDGPYSESLGSNCHLWKGSRNKDGNCYFSIKNVTVQAHRWSWEHAHGHIVDDQYCLRKCGRKDCMNPEHMSLSPKPKRKRK